MTVKEYLIFLLRKWWIFFIVAAIAIGLSTFYLSIRPVKYKAETVFMTVDESQGTISSLLQMAGQFGFSGGDKKVNSEKLIELMGTRKMILEALLESVEIDGVDKLLINHYMDIPGKDKWYDQDGNQLEPIVRNNSLDDLTIEENAIARGIHESIKKNNLSASDSDNGIIRANCVSRSEGFSKAFLENLVEKVSTFYVGRAIEKSQAELDLINARSDSIKIKLDLAEYNLSTWYDNQRNALQAQAVNAKTYITKVRLDREAEILAVAYEELMRGRELAIMGMSQSKPVIQMIDKPTFPLEKDEPNTVLIFGASLFGLLALTTFLLISYKLIRDTLRS